jgi:hypothetical protein
LVREFKAFLKGEKLDKSRDREETSRHLEVWRMVRRRGMEFNEIATELGITVDDAEFSFGRAYELTQGSPCPPGELLHLRGVEESALTVTCKTCDKHPDRGGDCPGTCEEIERYGDDGAKRWDRARAFSQIGKLDKDGEGKDQNAPEDSLRTDPLQEWMQEEASDKDTE